MLTADLVKVSSRAGTIKLVKLPPREDLLPIARALLDEANAQIGAPRGDALPAMTLPVPANRKLIERGLRKLVLDRCVFEEQSEIDPAALRATLFTQAAVARRAGRFDRQALVADAAREHAIEDVDAVLFADLKEAQRLMAVEDCTPDALLDAYELGRAEAVLLRATRLRAHIRCDDASTLRAVFRQLKFHGLLFFASRSEDGFDLDIDGPFSLFRQVTRYGLKLALALRALAACPVCRIEADVLWGKQKTPRTFVFDCETLHARPRPPPSNAREAILGLKERFDDPLFHVEEAAELIPVGKGEVCVPDLRFENRETGEVVYLEMLGFWSRDAVWRRVDWAKAGLEDPIIFAYSERLRVSEKALEDDAVQCLLAFKGTLSVPKVRACLRALSADRG